MVGPRVYFAATTPESGRELHVSETTSNSTRQVIDLVPGRESSNPRDLFALSSGLLFVADDETTEPRLWYLAESSADPVEVLALSGASSCQYVARPDGGTFIACTDNPALFSPRGRLWIFNNDPSPPLLLTTASSQWSEESLKWGTGTAFVTRGDGAVVRSDGTLQGTSATNVVAPIFHGSAVFTDGSYAVLAGNPDLQLWRVDAVGAPSLVRTWTSPQSHPPSVGSYGMGVVLTVPGNGNTSAPVALWVSDGTPIGTRRVTDIFPGAGHPRARFVQFGANALFRSRPTFSALDETLWTTDGTASGTIPLLIPAIDDYLFGVSEPHPIGGSAYFSFLSSQHNQDTCTWVTDGTPAETRRFGAGHCEPRIDAFRPVGTASQIIFPATDDRGEELWQARPDSPPELLADVYPGTGGTVPLDVGGVYTRATHALQSLLTLQFDVRTLFVAYQQAPSLSSLGITPLLGVTDGTAHGSSLRPASLFNGDGPADFIKVGDRAIVQTNFTPGYPYWSVDSTATEVRALLSTSCAGTGLGVVTDRALFYCGFGNLPFPPWANQFMVSHGTPETTLAIGSPYSFGEGANPIFVSSDSQFSYFFEGSTTAQPYLVRSNGTLAGTVRLASLRPCGNTISVQFGILVHASEPTGYCRLWHANGATGAVIPLPGPVLDADGTPALLYLFRRFGSNVIFVADVSAATSELWLTDGTTGGSRRVARLQAPNGEGGIAGIVVGPGLALVRGECCPSNADVPTWLTDGTQGGTALVDPPLPYFTASISLPDRRFVGAGYREDVGIELFQYDAQTRAVSLLADVFPGPGSSEPMGFFLANGALHFFATDPHAGRELHALPVDGVFANDFE